MAIPPEEFNRKLGEFARGLPKVIAKATFEASQTLLADIPVRIFEKGLDVKNEKIGSYSEDPILVGKKSFKTAGAANKVLGSKAKRRKLEWVNIKGHNLAVLEGGYKEVRRLSNLPADTVILRFHGDLKRSVKRRKVKNGYEIYIKGDKNVIKAEANEDRFKKVIFKATKKEREAAVEVFEDKLVDYIQEIF